MVVLASMQEILKSIQDMVNQCLGPLGSEGFSITVLKDFIIQIAATLLLFLIVRFFFWNKVTKFLEAKRSSIDEALENANKMTNEAEKYLAESKAIYEENKEKIRVLYDEAYKDAEVKREEIIKEAKEEAKKRLETANLEIEQEISKASADIKKEIVDIAFMAASKICEKEIDQDKYLDVVNKVIEEALK